VTDPNMVTVQFFDAANSLIGVESFNYGLSTSPNGVLDWHGWTSSTPFSRVSFSTPRGGILFDGLQANQASSGAVPEPTTLALWLVLGGAGLVSGIRRRRFAPNR
jgi:hypothetical protein